MFSSLNSCGVLILTRELYAVSTKNHLALSKQYGRVIDWAYPAKTPSQKEQLQYRPSVKDVEYFCLQTVPPMLLDVLLRLLLKL